MKESIKKIRPKALIYPRINCTIHYDDDKNISLRKIFVTKAIYENTLKMLKDKINELRDRIRYIELSAWNKDVLLLQYEYAEPADIDDMLEMLEIQYEEEVYNMELT